MPAPSIAKRFYEQLLAQPEPFAHAMAWVNANPPTVETEWLDFKAGHEITEDAIKRIWSKALAGFANTQGGVLVWGFDCRKTGDPAVDQVQAPSLIASPDAVASRLMELHHQSTEPPVLGIEVKAFRDPADASKGIVVCFIPESSFKPHRAEHAQQHYYIRAGDDFVQPSVSLLRSLFVPSSTALLMPSVRAEIHPSQPSNHLATQIRFLAHVKNTGLVSIEGALVTLHGNYHGEFWMPQGWRKHDTAMSRISFESPRAIHPGEVMQVFTFVPSISIRQPAQQNYSFPNHYEQCFELRIFSHNQAPIVAKMRFAENQIVHREIVPPIIEELR